MAGVGHGASVAASRADEEEGRTDSQRLVSAIPLPTWKWTDQKAVSAALALQRRRARLDQGGQCPLDFLGKMPREQTVVRDVAKVIVGLSKLTGFLSELGAVDSPAAWADLGLISRR